MDEVLVHGADLGRQLKKAGKTVPSGAEEAGIRHKNVDGNGDTCNGG